MTDDVGAGGEFARGGSRDGDDGVPSARGGEDSSDSSEDGVDEFLEGILNRKNANDCEAEKKDGGDGAALPPRGGGAGQARGVDDVPRQVGEGRGVELTPQRIVPSHNQWGGAIAVPRLPPKYVDPEPVDYRRPTPYLGYQRPKSPTATEYYSGTQHRTINRIAQHRPYQRDQQEKVFDLDEWEAARGAKRTDAIDRQQKTRNRSEGTYSKPYCKVRDSLDAKEKRANEVLAALESAKRSSAAASLASVAANAGIEEPADRAPLPPAVARSGADTKEESRDTSKEVNLLLALAAKPSSPDSVHHPDHESHLTSYYDHEPASAPPEPSDDPETDLHHRFVGTGEFYSAAITHSEIISNSASDVWKTMDDIENASLSVSSSNESPDSVSSGNKRKDRSGHPKLNQVAVDYLRSWLLSRQHIEQPYPSEQNYADLSQATGLEKPQLKNWFV